MEDTTNSANGSRSTAPYSEDLPGPHPDQGHLAGTLSVLAGMGIALYGLTRRSVRGTAMAVVGAGVAVSGARSRKQTARETVVHCTMTINKPRHEVYEQWRRLEDLPNRMKNLESVEMTGQDRSHWTAKGPLGLNVDWTAETVRQEQDTLLSWRSLPHAKVPNQGAVRFSDAPNGRGTQLDLTMAYRLPAGSIGAAVATLSGRQPQAQIESDLRRFKAILEGGEAPTTSDQPAGERSTIGRLANTWAGAR